MYYIDTIGPLPKTAESHKYILVVIDAFTRYVEREEIHSHAISVRSRDSIC